MKLDINILGLVALVAIVVGLAAWLMGYAPIVAAKAAAATGLACLALSTLSSVALFLLVILSRRGH